MKIVITYNFISLENSFFLCYYKPHLPQMYFTYSTWTFFRDPSLNLNLKALRDSDSFISLGSKSHIFGSRFSAMPDRIYSPSLKRSVIKKVIRTYFWSKSSFIISEAILFLTLNISVARACVFL